MILGLKPGDTLVALRNGGKDSFGLPEQRPVKGRQYVLTSIYPMKYGFGCTLEGMNPKPYRGYLLFVDNTKFKRGWYFRKLELVDAEVVEAVAAAEAQLAALVRGCRSGQSVLSCLRSPAHCVDAGRVLDGNGREALSCGNLSFSVHAMACDPQTQGTGFMPVPLLDNCNGR